MKLLIGLGNPGQKYARNRHNIGFMAIDDIAKAYDFTPWRSRFKGEIAEGRIEGVRCLLLKPHTFMNLSGSSVREAVQFYKIPVEDILVFHDEIDIAPGKVKVKTGGGNAGHNGLKSLSAHLENDYVRVRLGVGRPEHKSDVPTYVLKDFSKADQTWLDELLPSLSRHLPHLLSDNVNDFMSLLGQDLRPQQKSKKDETTSSRSSGPPLVTGKTKKVEAKTKSATHKKSALGSALEKWLGTQPNKGDK